MNPTLRPYQHDGLAVIRDNWASGNRNVLYALPTGGGKTVIFSHALSQHRGAAVAIAHRQELVGQISMSLARFGTRHRIIGPRPIIKMILEQQRVELGKTFYDPTAPIAVAGVDTLIRRVTNLNAWRQQVTLWVQDEAHHLLKSNKWGKAVSMFPNAKGLGVTATPERADGKGLGNHADGVFDSLIAGPSMRDLINDNHLADYRIFAPPNDLDLTPVRTAGDGDYNKDDLRGAVRKSHIIGDVVSHYKRIASGQLGITFATDVETACHITKQYIAAGVPAAMVNGETPAAERNRLIARFRTREILQLVNVDLFGEGFDVPAIEVISMARPTMSYAVFAQQFGRALRPLPGKTHGIVIDHVQNVLRHGLPDSPRAWSLDRRERSKRRERDPDNIPVTTCTLCFRVFPAITSTCPFCGHKPESTGRNQPDQVEGDLYELDAATLATMRGEIQRIDGPPQVPHDAFPVLERVIKARWRKRQEAQNALRENISLWAGYRRDQGMPDSEIYRRFFWQFGTDIMTAQTLGCSDADTLSAKLFDSMTQPICDLNDH